jgi:CheY-like chemotaxis protein
MFCSLGDSMFVMPICYHPTTILSVDDDVSFLKNLAFKVSDKVLLLCFNSPEEAMEYTKNKHHYFPVLSRCYDNKNIDSAFNLKLIRNEIFNPDRFKEITINVTDYDMPHTSGLELIKTMEFPPEVSQYTHIILTGKISTNFKDKLAEMQLSTEYIGKEDPDFVNKLLSLIQKRLCKIFQWTSYGPARQLSRDMDEKTTCLLDGNFAPLVNQYIKENNICELYLFDKQGSYLFLDDKANLSWLFVRNDQGIENTIKLAAYYNAPEYVIRALKDKKAILSLYEKDDFENKKNINWDSYLLPATILESDDTYLSFFKGLTPNENGKTGLTRYYYAFSKEFPEHGLDTNKILSYRQFLEDN